MKFESCPYSRLSSEAFDKETAAITELFQENAQEAFVRMDGLEKKINQSAAMASLRHAMDTADPFWKQENDWYDEMLPVWQKRLDALAKLVLENQSKLTDVPPIYFEIKAQERQTFRPDIIPLLQRENALASKYQALTAGGNLSKYEGLMQSPNRTERERAARAYWGWFEQNEEEIGAIFSEMIKVRTEMAEKLGDESYAGTAMKRMHRIGYSMEDLDKLCQDVLKYVVPLCMSVREWQKTNLHISQLEVWDEKVYELDPPRLKLEGEAVLEQAQIMYDELEPEMGVFFRQLHGEGWLDVQARENKAPGGFCTYLPEAGMPFVFANFNGTAEDMETVTHEAGHAFQAWKSRDIFPLDCVWPTMEACEIHSMSMEFLTWPWMDDFFENADAYWFSHMAGCLTFLPYGCAVHLFQKEVYAHPKWSHAEHMRAWKRLEEQYLPWRKDGSIDVVLRGGWWMRQLHIFMDPFYYIDYVLAQLCAFQFWQAPEKLKSYCRLCSLGGTLPFLDLVKEAGLESPFDCVQGQANRVYSWLRTQCGSVIMR